MTNQLQALAILFMFLSFSFSQPELHIISPENAAMMPNGSVSFSFYASGAYPLDCTLKVHNRFFGLMETNLRIMDNSTVTILAVGLPPTIQTWNISCVDSNGISMLSNTRQVLVMPYCGDSTCENSESCSTCPSDCGVCAPVCGDAICTDNESCSTCPSDCEFCQPECTQHACKQVCGKDFNCITWAKFLCTSSPDIRVEALSESAANSLIQVKIISGFQPLSGAYIGVQEPSGEIRTYKTKSDGTFFYFAREPGYYIYLFACQNTSLSGIPATYIYEPYSKPGIRGFVFQSYVRTPQKAELWVTEFGAPMNATLTIQYPENSGRKIYTTNAISGYYATNLSAPGNYIFLLSAENAKSMAVRLSLSSLSTFTIPSSTYIPNDSNIMLILSEIFVIFVILIIIFIMFVYSDRILLLFSKKKPKEPKC